ncbi:MAG: uracil-DNA glycosylase [Akkermansia sp.]|nr:uracil-DNA glycosylase [Akkermansia sp.]
MTPTLIELVCEGLGNLRNRGEERLSVDDSARAILRKWLRSPQKAAPSPASSPPAPVSLLAACHSPRDAAPETASRAPAAGGEQLGLLRRRADRWEPARRLGTRRDTMVFATGNPHAQLMLVGEAPGFDEERLREPFVGRAGQKLDQIIAAMGLKREELYISNICKFRPAIAGGNQGTANRAPSDEEIAACLPLILAEIRAIQPRCIICLGGTAAKGLLGSAGSVSSLRGRFHEVQGVPARVTYHPSYLLRNETLSAKRAVWEDMLAVMERLGMPVTERQSRYFLSAR